MTGAELIVERSCAMPKPMLMLGAVLIGAVVALVAWDTPPAFAQRARVPQTGQTTSYAAGDDGDIQAGVDWPPQRFMDRRDGTVRDNLTGLLWLRNVNCFGSRAWTQALTDANTLASGRCGLTDGSVAGDWHLPNVKELQSLIDFGRFGPALPDGHPYLDVQPSFYWSSTTKQPDTIPPVDPGVAWAVSLNFGATNDVYKLVTNPVWPVQGGD
jgi:hypothetical protein